MKSHPTLRRAGVHAHAHPDTHPDTTAALVLDALKARAPHLLHDILEAPGHDHARLVAAWASRHHLASESIIRRVIAQRRARTQGSTLAGVYAAELAPGEVDWCRRETHPRNLPDPGRETMEAWLTRAKVLYTSRAALRGGATRDAVARWSTVVRACAWFIELQVLGTRPARIAKAAGVDVAAVERATTAIAKRLDLERRRWPRGAPPKK